MVEYQHPSLFSRNYLAGTLSCPSGVTATIDLNSDLVGPFWSLCTTMTLTT